MEKDIWGNPLDRVVNIKDMLDAAYLDDTPRGVQHSLDEYTTPTTKKKYTQDWKSYDLAKTNQDIIFKKLLQELLFLSIEEDKQPKMGRKAYSINDRIFTMCIKVFYRADLRKTESMLKELKKLHYIEQVPCYKSLCNFFNDESMIKILDNLILISSLPLANVEKTGGIDGTGFALSRFENWSNYKWGKHEGKEKVWRKAHCVVGCATNIFISAEVTEKNVHDSRMVEKVVGNKTKFFAMENFVADKAYSSRKILEYIYNTLELHPYIPFKKNTSGKSKGSMVWAKLFIEFNKNRAYYMNKYHIRNNIEATFHMLKTKFGDHLTTKNLTANKNEIKIKILCHNICVLIQESFERDINIDFLSCVKKIELCNN